MSEQTKTPSGDVKTARSLSGRVTSNKMNKTITVQVDRRIRHPLYGKIVTRHTKLHAHDESNECKEGDLVQIEECRPLSKSKAWRLVKVLERAREV
ncbi:MAG: 30S ribosomal protein S17 [Sulfuricaulis sp.]|jgi:small subunit ribosomal protein S17|nr:30S ribosomal protein S17 [Sulfuricaulis sp.]